LYYKFLFQIFKKLQNPSSNTNIPTNWSKRAENI